MSLIRWQPLKELDTLRHQMNRVFDELMHSDREFNQFPKLETAMWAPAIELKETDTDLILKVAIPGISSEDLDVHVSENAVSIAGEHHEEKYTTAKGYFHSEFQHGQFQRTVPLPMPVKHDQVYAECTNGMLTITLPKAESLPQKVTKIDLTTQEKARESVAQQRLHDEQREEKLHNRAAAEIKTPIGNGIQAETRELTTEQRLHDEHLQETTHVRAVDHIGSASSQ